MLSVDIEIIVDQITITMRENAIIETIMGLETKMLLFEREAQVTKTVLCSKTNVRIQIIKPVAEEITRSKGVCWGKKHIVCHTVGDNTGGILEEMTTRIIRAVEDGKFPR